MSALTANAPHRSWGDFWIVTGAVTGILLVLSLIGLIIFRLMFVNFVDNYEIGYKFDSRTGAITVLHESGYYVTPPFVVTIHTIDMRPMQVCINANSRVLNCKLVQFDPKGIELFLSWHGRDNYSAPSSSSNGGSSSGSSAGTTTFSEILKSYAYDGTGNDYPFLKIIRELKPEESAEPVKK